MKQKKDKLGKFLSSAALVAVVLGGSGALPFTALADVGDPVKVTILKYVGGNMATAENASSTDFTMNATWNAANLGAPGTGQYTLSANGFGGDPTPYQAMTASMTTGADYSTDEVIDGVIVGATCSPTTQFALVGYTTGDTLAEAQSGTPSATLPVFTGMTSDKYVIVWNTDCSIPVIPPATDVKVHIVKYVDGVEANASSSQSKSFAMHAVWNATNIGQGSGDYTLDASNSFLTQTVDMTSGADYSTNELFDSMIVSDNCTASTTFGLVGYSTGDTFAAAAIAPQSSTSPSFTNITADKSVIVWNKTCGATTGTGTTTGTVGGDVTGGVNGNGTLAVTSVQTVKGSAIADGTFTNGWNYIFNITVPTNETHLSMKFADWLNGSGNSIPVANNVRISSPQADNSNATVLITAANTYSLPVLNMTGDLDLLTPGRQVKVSVEAAVPSNSVNGSYTTSYGVKTE